MVGVVPHSFWVKTASEFPVVNNNPSSPPSCSGKLECKRDGWLVVVGSRGHLAKQLRCDCQGEVMS